MAENTKKDCPFWKEPCREDKCNLWVQVQVGMVSPLGTVMGAKAVNMCVFPALLMVMGTPRPSTQQITGAPGINIDLKRQ
jgi:hypothetical protein